MSKWSKVQDQARKSVVQVQVSSRAFMHKEPYLKLPSRPSSGSGFFVDGGWIVTNAHVVEQAEVIHVQMEHYGRKLLKTAVACICPDKDLALLKVVDPAFDPRHSVPMTLGDSGRVVKTQDAMAIGFPQGHEDPNFAVGHVSGFNLTEKEFKPEFYQHGQSYLQITAPINPGNSGGPLVNIDGEVIGISAAGYLFSQSIGFAIPAHVLENFLPAMQSPRTMVLRTPYFGMEHCNTSTDVYGDVNGILVTHVYPDGALAGAVKKGDLLRALHWKDASGRTHDAVLTNLAQARVVRNGATPLQDDRRLTLIDLQDLIPPGSTVSCDVVRNSRDQLTVDCTFAIPTGTSLRIKRKHAGFETIPYRIFAGMCICPLDLNHDDGYQNDLEPFYTGDKAFKPRLMVTHVFDGTPLADLQMTDPQAVYELRSVQKKRVTTLAELDACIQHVGTSPHLHFRLDKHIFIVLDTAKVLQRDRAVMERLGLVSAPAPAQQGGAEDSPEERSAEDSPEEHSAEDSPEERSAEDSPHKPNTPKESTEHSVPSTETPTHKNVTEAKEESKKVLDEVFFTTNDNNLDNDENVGESSDDSTEESEINREDVLKNTEVNTKDSE